MASQDAANNTLQAPLSVGVLEGLLSHTRYFRFGHEADQRIPNVMSPEWVGRGLTRNGRDKARLKHR